MAKTFYGVVGNLLKKGTVIPAWSSLVTEVTGDPRRSGALTVAPWSMVNMLCPSRPHVGRDVHPDVAVHKLIRAAQLIPVKHTVARVLGGN
jgi:hypothetical protein